MEINELIGAICALIIIAVGFVCLTIYAIKVDLPIKQEKLDNEKQYQWALLDAIKSLKGDYNEKN